MKIVVQRSLKSSVKVDNKVVGCIDYGLVLLVGFTYKDNLDIIDYMVDKVLNLRIFDDKNGIMNKSLLDVGGDILSISQFTLYADSRKGRRPSYVNALNGEEAIRLYDIFNEKLKSHVKVETGIFGAEREVSITNDGLITIILERTSD